MGTSNGFLIGEFIGTTSLGGFPFPIFFLIKGASPFSATKNEKKKIFKIKTLFFFSPLKVSGTEPIHRLIPIYGGINHSPPYLLGLSPLGSSKHRRTSEEDERRKEYDRAKLHGAAFEQDREGSL